MDSMIRNFSSWLMSAIVFHLPSFFKLMPAFFKSSRHFSLFDVSPCRYGKNVFAIDSWMGKYSLNDNKRSISDCNDAFFFESSSISLLRPIRDLLSPIS